MSVIMVDNHFGRFMTHLILGETKAIRQIKKIKDTGVKAEIVHKINQLESYPDTPVMVSRYKTTNLLKFRV